MGDESEATAAPPDTNGTNHCDCSVEEIPHPSPPNASCTIPDEHCPRNDANEIVRINGLRYYKNFYSVDEQAELLAAIYEQPWQKILARRQQFYGEVYYHTNYRNKLLQPGQTEQEETPFSLDMSRLQPFLAPKCQAFFGEQGFPSQILVNEYLNNLGIASHFEDFNSFGPIILTLSLVSPVYMTLKKPKLRTNQCHEYWDIQKILLEPGSLLIMEDEARHDYRHGISKYKWVFIDGQEPICRDADYRRVSITMRHLLQTRRKVETTEDESGGWRYRACDDESWPLG